jgi:hypothetical protein
MKTAIPVALALLVGLFLGGLAPRAELRRTHKALAAAREEAARASRGLALPLAMGVGGLVAAAERAREAGEAGEPARRRPPWFVPGPATDEPGQGQDPSSQGRDGGSGAPDAGRRRRFRLSDDESFASAKAAADLRASQFRNAFLEQARMSPDKQAAFEDGIKRMNDDLGKAAEEMAESLRTKGQRLTPRDMADVGVKILDIYRSADDRFKGGLDDAGRAAAESTRFDVLTQIDLGGLRRLVQTVETLGTPDLGPQR